MSGEREIAMKYLEKLIGATHIEIKALDRLREQLEKSGLDPEEVLEMADIINEYNLIERLEKDMPKTKDAE